LELSKLSNISPRSLLPLASASSPFSSSVQFSPTTPASALSSGRGGDVTGDRQRRPKLRAVASKHQKERRKRKGRGGRSGGGGGVWWGGEGWGRGDG